MKQLITPVVLAFVCLFLTQNIYAQDCLGVCPADMRVPCDASTGGAVIDWIPPSIPDSCAVAVCESPQIYGFIYAGQHNGSNYYCSYNNYSWTNAKSLCQNNGGHLAVINDADENSFVSNFMMASSAWIGGHDYNNEGSFEWINGDPMNYTNWQYGQPNDYGYYGEDYMRIMKSSGEWTDKSNNNAYEVIMEVPCEQSDWVQVSGPAPGSVFPEGSTIVAYEYTDADGVLQTCSFEVLVEECVCLTCPADVIAECDPLIGGAEVSWEAPVPAEYCAGSTAPECADGEHINGFIYVGEHNGSHYYCSSYSNYSWPEAKALCESNGGHLAVINDGAENLFIQNFLMASSAWIGCNDITTEDSFEWVNGDPLGYTNWQYGQPNYYGNEDYVRIKRSTGEWTDRSASYRYECIMEIPCEEPFTPTVIQTAGPASGEFLPENSEEVVTYEYTDADGTVHTCSFNVLVGFCGSSSSRLDNSAKPCKGETLCSLSATPNPTDGLVQLTYLAEHDLVTAIHVYNGAGERLMEKTIMGREGLNQADLDLSALTEGVYYVQVQMRGETQTVKVIKTR